MRANRVAIALAFSGLLPGCPTSSGTTTPPVQRPRNPGQPEFDWTAQGTPPAAQRNMGFVDQPTTLAHVVWNGRSWVDTKGLLSFQPVGAPVDHSMGMNDPPRHYVSGFGKSTYFIADAAHGGNAFDTSGAFTVCAKVKPGANPGFGANKVFVAKGQAEGDATYPEGWALMQMHWNFCFHYRTAADGERMSFFETFYTERAPEDRSFDYLCGGRTGSGQGTTVWVNGHGVPEVGSTPPINGTFATPWSLPLSIGAYPTGDDAHTDGGVYEVIWDSRPMGAAVVEEIVRLASRQLRAGSGRLFSTLDQLDPPTVTTTSERGADLADYVFPPFVPGFPTMDYTAGAIAGNAGFTFTTPIRTDTTVSGFCLGAEIASDWGGAPSGTIIEFAANGALTEASDLRVAPDGRYCFTTTHASAPGFVASCVAHAGVDGSWAPGSRHKLIGCISPIEHVLKLYVDGTATSAIPATVAGIPQLNEASGRVTVGPSLVGGHAVIYRGFICTDPSQCT
jgi:hypothetical protein